MKIKVIPRQTKNKKLWLLAFLAGYVFLSSFLLLHSNKDKPTLYIIGDSTVKAGRGHGEGGLWGWGNFVDAYFDTTRLKVENAALGGTSSRTFRTRGHWNKVLDKLKAGDYVLMQFGHNDSSPINDTLRARGTIRSNGEEMQEIDNLITKQHEVVHSYGWYIRQFISDAQAKGAILIVLSPIPRNNWQNGKVNRASATYGKWAAEAANQGKSTFIDLNKLIADRYDTEGEAKVKSTYFNATDHTHTIEAGARLNAAVVVNGIAKIKNCPIRKYLTKTARKKF